MLIICHKKYLYKKYKYTYLYISKPKKKQRFQKYNKEEKINLAISAADAKKFTNARIVKNFLI